MPFILPKKDWVAGNKPTKDDFNRIEGDIDVLANLRGWPTAGGTGTAITVTTGHFEKVNGRSFTFIASAGNGGAATTINADGTGASPFYKPGTTVAPNITAGKAYTVWYKDGSFFLKASAEGNLTADKALAGDTFSNDNDTGIVGTMPNRAGDTAALASSIDGTTLKLRASEGYRDGVDDNVTITDPNWVSDNIPKDLTMFGKVGTRKDIIVLFSGTADIVYESSSKGYVRCKSSGVLSFPKDVPASIDVFVLGGGGGGAGYLGSYGSGGGGGGYTKTSIGLTINPNTNYNIVVGAGGRGGHPDLGAAVAGGYSEYVNSTYRANGGNPGVNGVGGSGGSGGGGGHADPFSTGGAGGSNGSNGASSSASGGAGQGTTTRAFGDATGELYAGGGGGSSYAAGGAGGGGRSNAPNYGGSAGTTNYGGGGGGGAGSQPGGYGGSGVVIIRWGY